MNGEEPDHFSYVNINNYNSYISLAGRCSCLEELHRQCIKLPGTSVLLVLNSMHNITLSCHS